MDGPKPKNACFLNGGIKLFYLFLWDFDFLAEPWSWPLPTPMAEHT